MLENRDELVAEISRAVVARLREQLAAAAALAPAPGHFASAALGPSSAAGDHGVFEQLDDAVRAATEAQRKVAALSLADRGRMIDIIRRICEERKQELAAQELAETKVGRLSHKIEKLEIVRNVIGVEAMQAGARTDSSGLCLIENAPWGVIGMILPATHSVPTMASNAINILASGNAAIFNPHPSGAKVAAYAMQLFNQEFERAVGVANALTMVANPTIRTAEGIFHHPGVALLCVTGGGAVVKAAAKSGKRVIAAGPGNPPVVVDETADLDKAAAGIIEGAAFDNNLLCIGEKEVFVVASVADALMAALRRAGAVQIDAPALQRLTQAAFDFEDRANTTGCGRAHVKRDLVGKDASVLAAAAGVQVPPSTTLLFAETTADHAFVQEEQMMPFLPIVRVPNVAAAIEAAAQAEHNYRHTAVIHSNNVDTATAMARRLNTTLFVQNGASVAALGAGGAGYLSFTIATPTGEGVTTPLTFTRQRQFTVAGGALRIY